MNAIRAVLALVVVAVLAVTTSAWLPLLVDAASIGGTWGQR